MHQKVLSMILVLVMLLGLLSMSAFTTANTTSSDSAASNDDFKRIVHIDCGRKYFSAADLKKIIKYAAENHYTDVELAFGNDGLRFLLDNMSLDVNGKTYDSNPVKTAIQKGNKEFYNAGTNELTESEMTDIISCAKKEGIGIIPMFDAPGHLQAVVKAMKTLGMSPAYTTPTTSGTSVNYAINTTDTTTTSFVKALMQKYITYFKDQGCTMFNFAADECGFSDMTNAAYTSYAEFVNDLAAMVKSANMTPMAFNDGIYYKKFTSNTEFNTKFDTDILVCYWDATAAKYAPAAELATKGFKILNTNNKWYYVIGTEGTEWWGCGFAKQNMRDIDCLTIDGDNKQTTPVGCMAPIWCDTPSASVNWDNVKSYISTFSTSNPDYFKASATTPEKPGVQQPTENKTVSVTVGGTTTVTIDNKNLSADGQTYETENSGIATVTVTGQDEKLGNVTYTSTQVSYSTLAGSNDTWTRTEYYYKVGENYYPVYAYYNYYGYYYYGYSTTDSADNVKQIGNGTWNGSRQVSVYKKSGQATIPASTTLTFKGVAVGTTYVTIDNVKYTIQVTQENLEGKTLPMQLWFTTCDIEVDTSTYKGGRTSDNFVSGSWQENKRPYYVSVAATDAYGESGVPLTSVLPETMYRYENSNTYWIQEYPGKVKNELVLWSGRVHDSSNLQLISGKDYSNSGSEFQYVRYYNGKWAVSVDRAKWIPVTGEGSTVSASSCKEQLAVYYMMRSQITQEVSTDVADWGYVKKDTQYKTQIDANQYVMLDFSVKYQDNTRNPSTFPQDGKTFLFHCTPNDGSGAVKQDSNRNYYRQLNNFRGMNTGDYEIYMITVTMTDGSASNTITDATSYAYDYTNTEQIVWAIDEATKDKSGLDPYTSISGSSDYSGCKIGGDPYVRGVEVYNQHGALITYYVRAKITTDALQVHYVNQTTGYEFYNYPIVVNSGTHFDTGFAYVSGPDQESGSLRGNTVINSLGVEQTIQSDLASIPEIGAQYRYGNFKFVDATRTDDKNVTLYYTFNTTKKFVVDFGLPLKIRPQDIAPKLAAANLTKVVVGDSQYADITHDDQLNIIYKLNTAINGQDDITVTYYGTNEQGKENNATYTVSVIPATSVYYEDSFAAFTDGTGKASAAKWKTDTDDTDPKATTTQALTELGKMSADDVYGHDAAYADSTKFSMGSAHKVTVNANMVKDWTDGSAWPSATFTFNGTGFDIISLTDNTSGAIFVDVYAGKEATGTPVKQLTVNNYYGYTQDGNGKWVVGTGSSNALYQIPVMKVSGLDYGEYTAVIRVAYSKFFDTANKNQYSFWLDAIRVYDPMGKDNATYKKDGEGYPQYIKLRDEISKDDSPVTANVLFIDGGPEANVDTYKNYGPNNEVYLAKDQAIAFNVPKDTNIASIQIGAKAPNGSAAKMVVNDGKPEDIQSATEMYYKIGIDGGNFTITNTGTGILSLTNLKITYTASGKSVSLAPLTNADQENAVAQVRALFAAPAEPFQPERFEASWGHAVRKGDTATLTVKTSEDVDSITVDGQTITAYATKTERTGWGWWAKTVTYREFTYQVAAEETTDYTICAVNSAGVSSDPITATLTVRPSVRDWWHGIFDKWF